MGPNFDANIKDIETSLPKKEVKIDIKRNIIADKIGRGQDAKNSIAYLTLKWCFISLLVGFICVTIYTVFQICKGCNDYYIENLTKCAGIITPIITLVLGYVFGRSNGELK